MHEDHEIRSEDFDQRVRAALRPGIAIVGACGAREVRSIAWWEGTLRGPVSETHGQLDALTGASASKPSTAAFSAVRRNPCLPVAVSARLW